MAKLGLWIIILGLGLAACSGGGTGDTTNRESEGDTGQPSEALRDAEARKTAAETAVDNARRKLAAAGTQAERDEAMLERDAALAAVTSETARVSLETIRGEIQTAVRNARQASTPEQRTAARTDLNALQTRLAEALSGATSALDAARAALGADGASRAGASAIRYAEGVQTRARANLQSIRSANQEIDDALRRVSATPAPEPEAGPGDAGTATIMRYPRAESDGTELAESDRLKIATAAVPYSAGKRVIAADRTGSDELPIRDLTLRIGTTTAGDVKIQGRDGTETTYTETDGVPVSSINLGSDRVVYKFGGEGVTFHDTQRRFDIGTNKDNWKDVGADGQTGGADDSYCWQSDLARCSAWNSYDLEITWQAGLSGSRNSPNGEPVYYWSSRVPFPEGQSATHPHLLETFQNGRNDWDPRLLRALGDELRRLRQESRAGRRKRPAGPQRRRRPVSQVRGLRGVRPHRHADRLPSAQPGAGVPLRLRRVRGQGGQEDHRPRDADQCEVQRPNDGLHV